ncbi:MAG: hypothetical protein OXG85_12870 [Chloroflexi bacterium]|nr:hypothetical protein [Chloroflexota bacterium]
MGSGFARRDFERAIEAGGGANPASVAFALIEAEDAAGGAISFYGDDPDSPPLCHFAGEICLPLIEYVKAHWQEDTPKTVYPTALEYRRPSESYRVILTGDISDGTIYVETMDGEEAPEDIGWDLAMRFNNHPERLALLKRSGSEGIVFRRWTDDQP